MDTLRLGPLLLPATPLLLLLGGWAAEAAARAVARGAPARPGPALLVAALVALVVARIGFVLRWHAQYPTVLSWLDLRDRGLLAAAGWVAGALVLLAWGWRRAALRRPLAAGFAVAALIVLGGQALLRALQPPPRMLPVIALQDLQGHRVDLQELRGKPLVINLWATWCPPCQRELPMLLQHAAAGDARIVLVDQGDAPQAVRGLLRALGHADSPRVLLDEQRALSAWYNVPGFPTTLFVRADGSLQREYVGEMSAATLQQGIERLRREPR